jgi:pyridoxine 4-dehydrogenase
MPTDETTATAAGTWTLGDHTVNRMGFGSMRITANPDRDLAIRVLRRAVELGVNHIDTSQVYGPDVVNELIAAVLHPYPEDLVIATKVGGARDDQGGWIRASRPEQLRATVEADLRLLRLERIDLVNLRCGVGGPDPDTVPLAEQLGVLTDLRDEGKLDLIGISTVSADVVEAALAITPIAEVQNAFSIVNREDQPVIDLCREHEIAYVPYYPLGSAFIGGPAALAADPAIASVAAKHRVSPAQIALAWLLAHYDRMLLIPGTSSVAHLEKNLAVGNIQLDDDDLATLDDATQIGGPGF